MRGYAPPARLRRLGLLWCHLLADSPDELHAFASRLGLKRKWFQDGRWPHYDLTASKRDLAVGLGAEQVRAVDWMRRRRRGETMAQIVFGSPEALAILKKDGPLREQTAKEARIEEAKRTGKIGRFEVFIEEDPPPERSVIIEAWTDEEAQEIAKRDLGYNDSISGMERII